MALSEELTRLQDLHQRGALSDDEFARAKAKLLEHPSPLASDGPSQALSWLNALRRRRDDRWIAGVCSGIAAAFGVKAWVMRLVLAVLLLCAGTGFVIYLLLWIFVPNE